MRDPLPVYEKLREQAPCYHIEEFDAWALSRFEDIWAASMDNEHYTATLGTTSSHLLTKVQPVTPMINLMDPPQHSKLRSSFRPYFSAPQVAHLEKMIRDMAIASLAAARDTGRIDVMGELSSQIAVSVACTVNGLPVEDGPMLNDLVWRFFKREKGHEGMTEAGLAAFMEMDAYFKQQIAKRRAQRPVFRAGDNTRSAIDPNIL